MKLFKNLVSTADLLCIITDLTMDKSTVSKNFSNRLRNILKRDFDPASPDAAWCTDITYIWTYDDGFVYLTSVMDLFSRKIISWVLTKDMTAESVLEAIKLAQKRRNIRKQLLKTLSALQDSLMRSDILTMARLQIMWK